MYFCKYLSKIGSFLSKCLNWLGRFLNWLFRTPPASVKITITSVIVLFLLLLFIEFKELDLELPIRIVGVFYQLIGTFTVVCEIREKLKSFNEPNPIEKWIAKFPSWNNQTRYIDSSVVVTGTGGFGKERLSVTSTKIEDRVAMLEKKYNHLENKIDNNERKNNQLNVRLEQEEESRKKLETELKKQIKENETTNIYIPLLGVVQIFFGTILSTFSSEINSCL